MGTRFPGIKYAVRLSSGIRVHWPREQAKTNRRVRKKKRLKKKLVPVATSTPDRGRARPPVKSAFKDVDFADFFEPKSTLIYEVRDEIFSSIVENESAIANMRTRSAGKAAKTVVANKPRIKAKGQQMAPEDVEILTQEAASFAKAGPNGAQRPPEVHEKVISCVKGCGFETKLSETLFMFLHLKQVHGDPVYVCSGCPGKGSYFYLPASLKKHIVSQHQESEIPALLHDLSQQTALIQAGDVGLDRDPGPSRPPATAFVAMKATEKATEKTTEKVASEVNNDHQTDADETGDHEQQKSGEGDIKSEKEADLQAEKAAKKTTARKSFKVVPKATARKSFGRIAAGIKNERVISCQFCFRTFILLASLQDHLEDHHQICYDLDKITKFNLEQNGLGDDMAARACDSSGNKASAAIAESSCEKVDSEMPLELYEMAEMVPGAPKKAVCLLCLTLHNSKRAIDKHWLKVHAKK